MKMECPRAGFDFASGCSNDKVEWLPLPAPEKIVTQCRIFFYFFFANTKVICRFTYAKRERHIIN